MSLSTLSFVRRSTWSATAVPIAFGVMRSFRWPGATNSKIPTRSSALFSIGVPVSAQLRPRVTPRTAWLVWLERFLIRWASSSTTRSNARPSSATRSRSRTSTS